MVFGLTHSFHFQLPYEVMKQYHTQSHSQTFRRESCHSKRQCEHHCYCNGNPSYDYFATFHSSIQLLAVKSVCEPNCLNSFISCFRKRLSISEYCFWHIEDYDVRAIYDARRRFHVILISWTMIPPHCWNHPHLHPLHQETTLAFDVAFQIARTPEDCFYENCVRSGQAEMPVHLLKQLE